jgi:hypothetical protein
MSEADKTERLINPGDVAIDEIFVTPSTGSGAIDLGNLMVELNIYEDIWNCWMHGDIVMNDAVSLLNDGPIRGGEQLTIKLRTKTYDDTPENVIHKSFQIYAIENRGLNNDREESYVLRFLSIEGMTDSTININKRFTGNTVDIVEEIYNQYLIEYRHPLEAKEKSELIIGDTPHASQINYISNWWTPAQNLNYISKYVRGNSGVGSDFIFYESNKRFYFTSIQQMIKSNLENGLLDEYSYSQPGLDIPPSGEEYTGIKLPDNHVKIDNIVIPRTIDIVDGQDNGYYAQSVRAYDLFFKERYEAVIDVRETFDSFVHTDPGIPIPEGIRRSPFQNITFKLLNSGNFFRGALRGIPGGNSQNANDAIVHNTLYRNNYFNSFRDYTFEISVPGRTDIEVGRMIKMNYPRAGDKPKDSTYDDIIDPNLSGNYLITAIHHSINNYTGHTMKMEICKNGLPESLGGQDKEGAGEKVRETKGVDGDVFDGSNIEDDF